ncbi:MAG: hypothetical protein J7M34_05250, partial [Anaerolineae bacterium]|nr:hypothetical protein [Anaerolineae bacterium]
MSKSSLCYLTGGLAVGLLLVAGIIALGAHPGGLFGITGEEELFPQIKALTDLAGDLLRPRVHTADN